MRTFMMIVYNPLQQSKPWLHTLSETWKQALALRALKGSLGCKNVSLDARFDVKPSQNANPEIFVRGIQYEYTGLGFPSLDWNKLLCVLYQPTVQYYENKRHKK